VPSRSTTSASASLICCGRKDPDRLRRDPRGLRPGSDSSAAWPPQSHVRSAPCHEVIYRDDDVDLAALAPIQAWPDDGGAYFKPRAHPHQAPGDGCPAISAFNRLQVQDRRTLGMHWQIHKDSNAHHAVAERRGERFARSRSHSAATRPLPYAAERTVARGHRRVPVRRLLAARARRDGRPASRSPLAGGRRTPRVVLGGLARAGHAGNRRVRTATHTGFYTPGRTVPPRCASTS